jgi:hypothetical protein
MNKLLLLLLFPITVLANDVTGILTIEAPTQYTDGSPLDPALMQTYQIYYSIDKDVTGTETPWVMQPNTEYSFTIPLTPRANPYTVYFRASVTLKDGRTSDLSAAATRTYQVDSTANPNPPNLSFVNVTVSCTPNCNVTVVGP